VIAPCLVGVGESWARGELTVGHEHLTSAAVRARLERTLAEPRGAVRGRAVLACAPGEQHELGLLMLACLLRADGWDVVYLGQCTPVADAIEIARRRDAAVVAVSVTMPENVEALERGFAELQAGGAPLTVVGGAAASEALARRIGWRYVGDDLTRAVPALREAAPT
jgi:methanogenic corrinoid protein MtbC1